MATVADLPPSIALALTEREVSLSVLDGESSDDRDRRLETSLMALFRDLGLEAAYEVLYRRTRRMLLAWIMHLLGTRGQSADPVEELFPHRDPHHPA